MKFCEILPINQTASPQNRGWLLCSGAAVGFQRLDKMYRVDNGVAIRAGGGGGKQIPHDLIAGQGGVHLPAQVYVKIMYLSLGMVSLGLGILGIPLPILPTTLFLLLAIACFTRSSKRFEKWLYNTKLYQTYVADFRETKSIAKERKKKSLSKSMF